MSNINKNNTPGRMSVGVRALIAGIGVLLILLGVILSLFTAVPGGVLIVLFLIGAVLILFGVGSGTQVLMGGYEAMRKKPERGSLHDVQQCENPWESILAESDPRQKKAENCPENHDALARLNARYRDGLISKQEYKQKKQEILRKNQ